MADNSKPWESGTSGKYQYHPGGDRTAAPRDAPSALHSVIIPEVSLPKVSSVFPFAHHRFEEVYGGWVGLSVDQSKTRAREFKICNRSGCASGLKIVRSAAKAKVTFSQTY